MHQCVLALSRENSLPTASAHQFQLAGDANLKAVQPLKNGTHDGST
jgi:hypothetical protein